MRLSCPRSWERLPRQLGIFDDKHIEGLTKLTTEIKKHNSIAIAQLHHAGMRSPVDLIDTQPVCPSENENTGAKALSTKEVVQLIDDFVAASVRAKKSGYQGYRNSWCAWLYTFAILIF